MDQLVPLVLLAPLVRQEGTALKAYQEYQDSKDHLESLASLVPREGKEKLAKKVKEDIQVYLDGLGTLV